MTQAGKTEEERVGIKRPVNVTIGGNIEEDGDSYHLLCEVGDTRAHEIAACINLAPQLAEALLECVMILQEVVPQLMPTHSQYAADTANKARTLLATWDRETSNAQ